LRLAYPKISVLLPVYNAEKYIKDAINSILIQTFQDFELVILNDGSTDKTEMIILSFDDNRIKYHKSENKGIVYQLNKGVELAAGEYIARMDSDDISLPARLSKQIEFMEQHPNVDALGTAYFRIDERGKKIGEKKVPSTHEECEFMATLNSPILHPTLMIKKDVIKEIGGYKKDFNLIEDYELFLRLIKSGYKMANLKEPLFYYRLNKATINSEREKCQQNAIYKYGNAYLLDKLSKEKSATILLQLALIEYYLGTISKSRKYFFNILLNEPSKIFLVLRYLPILMLGDHITRFLLEREILLKLSYFMNSSFKTDMQRLFR